MTERVGPWSYAHDELEEHWKGRCETREEAIAEGTLELGIAPGGTFFIDTGTIPSPAEAFDVDRIIEFAEDYANDNWGEISEQWPDVSAEARAELANFLAEWACKHCQCDFWIMDGSPEKVVVPAKSSEAL